MKRIFLPIEIKVREFHSKLLFALFAAERGIETVIGGQLELIERMPKLGKGIYIDKSTAVTKPEWFAKCFGIGNYVAAWDEEGLVYLNDEVYHTTRMCDEAFALVDLFFSWGEFHKRTVVAGYPAARDLIVPTGNPRMDLLRPEYRRYCDKRVNGLKAKYGRILLVNTNFPLANFAKGQEAVKTVWDPYPFGKDKVFCDGWYNFQKSGYEGYREAALAMHEHFPDHTIIIRPAPAEKIEPWQELFAGMPRGVVSKEGNVVEWIRAAEAVLEFNCTTSIEAFLLGVPSVSYRCAVDERFEPPLPRACSIEVETMPELMTVFEKIVQGTGDAVPPRTPKQEAIIADFLTGRDGLTVCERVLNEIEARNFKERPYTLPTIPLIKRVWRAWLKVVRRHNPDDVRFYRTKFPGLTVEEARELADGFAQATGRFANIQITRAGNNIIKVRPR